MPSAAVHGWGTQFQISSGATPAVYSTIAEVTAISAPGMRRGVKDVTNMDSPMAAREIIATILELGEFAVDVNYIGQGATQKARIAAALSGLSGAYRVVWPNFGATSYTASLSGDSWTTATHGWLTGQPVKVTTTGTFPTSVPQMKAGAIYFARRTSATEFTLHATNAGAVAGTGLIDCSTAGSGTFTAKSGSVWTFAAFCTGWEPTLDKDSEMKGRFTFSINGPVAMP